MTKIGDHAVVVGASIGGLLAARVLTDFYGTVTVVERDVLPDDPGHRRGVPQGRHGHALLARGSQIMGELFPGLLDELVAGGARVLADGDFSRFYFSPGGHLIVRSGIARDPDPVYVPSRPFLEGQVRRRLRAIANVTMMDGHGIVELTAADRDRVTGGRVVNRVGGGSRTLTADLVVDATGRGSRTPAFLEHLGYGRPDEDHVVVDVAYASQLLRIPAGTLREGIVLVGARPGRPTGMALFGYENDTWLFTVAGMAGREPPRELAEMIAFAEEFGPAHVLAAIRDAEPIGEVARHRLPSNQWRRYDRMRRFPDGLLVFGDAICSFNPLYGQGMTVAALEAVTLRGCLQRGGRDLPRRFFRAASKPISVAWQIAVGADLALPEVEGPRPLPVRISNAYVEKVLTAAESDTVVAGKFLRVTGLLDPPARLVHPTVMARVVIANRRRRRRANRAPAMTGAVR